MGYRHFLEMPVWQKGHEAGLLVYELTSRFPSAEKYGLTSQMRRAAVSIASNIAEAFGRQSGKDKVRFYLLARGSCFEVQSQSYLARDVGYLHSPDHTKLSQSLGQILHDLNKITKTLSARSQPKP